VQQRGMRINQGKKKGEERAEKIKRSWGRGTRE
jgi:hypothetical protein